MFQGGAGFSLKTISQHIFPMSYSKRMPALMAAAAGNYITVWPSDFTGLLRFPRQGPVSHLWLCHTAFLRNVLLWEGQNRCVRGKPARVAGTLRREFLLLTTSVWVRMCSAPDPSLSHIRVCVLRCQEAEPSLMAADLWRCFAYCTYGAGSQWRVESGGLLHRVLQNL